jgi:hypothetical protein
LINSENIAINRKEIWPSLQFLTCFLHMNLMFRELQPLSKLEDVVEDDGNCGGEDEDPVKNWDELLISVDSHNED